jgi:cob(I)alamin adenosyltransferase
MLYSGKGDGGTTCLFGCDQKKISKSSALIEALGALDEVNSFLGLCKVKADALGFFINPALSYSAMISEIQNALFIIQAEVARSVCQVTINESHVHKLEYVIESIEKQIPPIKTFIVSGGTELAALFDFSRTLARRAERRVISVDEEEVGFIGYSTKAYLNRLSSVLYALARLSNHHENVKELAPLYK